MTDPCADACPCASACAATEPANGGCDVETAYGGDANSGAASSSNSAASVATTPDG